MFFAGARTGSVDFMTLVAGHKIILCADSAQYW
jgi:hypothetical protein